MSNELPPVTDSSSLVESSTLIPVEVAQLKSSELTQDEQRDCQQLELQVEQAFYQAGKALAELRQRRLYRSTHETFEAYCQARFDFSRRYSDYLIAAASVVENLQQPRTNRSQKLLNKQNEFGENPRTIHAQILPTNVEQTKPLAPLKPEEQRQVWDKAVETAGGIPSGRMIKEIVKQLKQKPTVLTQDNWHVGDVFTLKRLEGKDKKYNGCWAVVLEVTDGTVMVDVHDATLTVKPENLHKIDALQAHQQIPQILQRIRRLREVGFLDRGATNILEDLGKHTDLTSVEEGLLSWLEKYYEVDEQDIESDS